MVISTWSRLFSISTPFKCCKGWMTGLKYVSDLLWEQFEIINNLICWIEFNKILSAASDLLNSSKWSIFSSWNTYSSSLIRLSNIEIWSNYMRSVKWSGEQSSILNIHFSNNRNFWYVRHKIDKWEHDCANWPIWVILIYLMISFWISRGACSNMIYFLNKI